jgi:hypothetical protein
MSITHSVSVRNVLANTAVGLIDIGAGPNGTLVISQVTPTPIDIAIIKFQAKASHAFGLAVDGVCTANALPLEGLVTAPGTTQAQVFSVKGCDGNVIFQGTVSDTGGGGDIQLLSINLEYDYYVRLEALNYTASL